MIGGNFMKKRLIFDFDGVLADSLFVTMDNINYLSKNGFDKIPVVYNQNEMSHLFDVKLSDSLLKYGYDRKEIKEFFNMHTSMMCRDADKILVFKEIISFLRKSNLPISIVSSSYLVYMQTILNNYSKDVLQIFDEVYGREIQGSKIEKINNILCKYGLKNCEVLYIGDTVSDILTCREIGIEIVAVGYGFHPYEYLLNFAPDYIVRNENELINLLNMLHIKAA